MKSGLYCADQGVSSGVHLRPSCSGEGYTCCPCLQYSQSKPCDRNNHGRRYAHRSKERDTDPFANAQQTRGIRSWAGLLSMRQLGTSSETCQESMPFATGRCNENTDTIVAKKPLGSLSPAQSFCFLAQMQLRHKRGLYIPW